MTKPHFVPDDLIKKLMTLPTTADPGVEYHYSNGNYVLLAKVIEKVAGKSEPDFVAQTVFRPLDMKHAYILQLKDLPNCVHGYFTKGGGVEPALFNPGYCYGNGDIGASLDDLEKFDAGLYTEKVVKADTFKEMLQPRPLNDGSYPPYGLGWEIGRPRDFDAFSHTGKVDGWRSHFVGS